MNLWLKDKDRQLNQRKRKKYKKKQKMLKSTKSHISIYPQFLMLILRLAVVNVKLRTRNDSIHLLLEFCLKFLTVEILFKRL